MTDTVDKYGVAAQEIRRQARGAGYRRGADAVVNLVAAFQARGITFGDANGIVPGQNEK
ncbi:MAG: hypothetical protein IJ560_04030 [Alphaproteobacteria bacterium]|nr:hypothetical protein [Alphaproteobacteria bacterium]